MFVRRCCCIQRRLGWRSTRLSQRDFSVQPLKKQNSLLKQVTEDEFVDQSESPRVGKISIIS
jgi:hypothetical protein